MNDAFVTRVIQAQRFMNIIAMCIDILYTYIREWVSQTARPSACHSHRRRWHFPFDLNWCVRRLQSSSWKGLRSNCLEKLGFYLDLCVRGAQMRLHNSRCMSISRDFICAVCVSVLCGRWSNNFQLICFVEDSSILRLLPTNESM